MGMHRNDGAAAPGLAAPDRPASDDAPGVVAEGVKGQSKSDKRNFRAAPHAGQALRVIEGETKAARYLARLQAQRADPDELAVIVSMLYGAALRGFCRAIEKALGVQHA